MLNNSREGEHLCLVAFMEEAFISPWNIMLAMGLSYMVYTIMRNLKIKTKLPKLPTTRTSPKMKNYICSVTEKHASLKTFYGKNVYFACDNEDSEIYVQDVTKEQDKDIIVLLTFYHFQSSSASDDVDGHMSIVSLSHKEYKHFLLHADEEKQSVKLQETKEGLPDKALFHLHVISVSCVKFECKNNPGVFIGVKGNQLTLIKTEEIKEMNTVFTITELP